MPPWVSSYVGLPFEDEGRGPDTFDCYGLARWVLAREFGIEIPAYTGYETTKDHQAVAAHIEHHLSEWVRAERPRLGDVVMFRRGKWPLHLGLAIDRTHMLHIEEGIDSCVERIDSPVWRARYLGAYRYCP